MTDAERERLYDLLRPQVIDPEGFISNLEAAGFEIRLKRKKRKA
jgi:predicted metalloprotease